jgi:DNA-binding IclR family transcriptional regulator
VASSPTSVGQRAFALLEAFKSQPVLGVSDLSKRVGLPKTTVHRIAQDLLGVRALEGVDGKYRIGLGLLELGTLHYHPSLREVVFPYLEDLHHLTQGTVHVAVLGGEEVVYVEHLGARGTRSVRLGGRLPALATATGRLLLAFGPQTARERLLAGPRPPMTPKTLTDASKLRAEFAAIVDRGYSVDIEGVSEGYVSVAVPLRDARSSVVAALTVLGSVGEFDHERAVPTALAIARILDRITKARGADSIV